MASSILVIHGSGKGRLFGTKQWPELMLMFSWEWDYQEHFCVKVQ